MADKYIEFFLNSHSSVVQLELLEISHTSFTKTYYVVRNATDGVEVTLETGNKQFFSYYPLKIDGVGLKNDLDYAVRVQLGDLGAVLPTELDSVAAKDNFFELPIVVYRTYRSDELSFPIFGPILLEVQSFTFDRTGSVFEAKAPSLNVNRTGEVYNLERFPMLRGFL